MCILENCALWWRCIANVLGAEFREFFLFFYFLFLFLCAGRRVSRICAEADAYSEKMLVIVTLYSDCTGALSFENVCGGGGFRYLGPLAGVV